MEYALAIGYMETVMLDLKFKKKPCTRENIQEKLNDLLDKDKEAIVAYIKVALYNIENSPDKVTIRKMEAEIQYLKDSYTLDKLIEVANNLKEE